MLRRKGLRITLATESIPSDVLSHILHFLDNATVWEVCRVNRVRRHAASKRAVCFRGQGVNGLAIAVLFAAYADKSYYDADGDTFLVCEYVRNAVTRICTVCV